MNRDIAIFLAGIVCVCAGSLKAQTCDTMFTASDATRPFDWRVAHNWTSGIPRAGQTVCIPEPLRAQMEDSFPPGLSVVYVDMQGGVAGEFSQACCVGSACVELTPTDCESQAGYLVPGVGVCVGSLCATGACCDGQANCTDRNAFNQPMAQSDCEQQSGTYRGGAQCNNGDVCGFQQIPEGYEIIEIAPPDLENQYNNRPRLNDCGEIVFGTRYQLWDGTTWEIVHYDNGLLTRLTDNSFLDTSPDINNDGVMAWMTGSGIPNSETLVQIVRKGLSTQLAPGSGPNMNNHGQATWYEVVDPESCAFTSVIRYYDGETVRTLFDDGLSNQTPQINDHADMTWSDTFFPCGPCCNWTATILFYFNQKVRTLPTIDDQPSISSIDDIVRVAWNEVGGSDGYFRVFENNVATNVATGGNPALNNRGDIAYNVIGDFTPKQQMLLRDGVTYHISSLADRDNDIDNGIIPRMNDTGEIVWSWHPNHSLIPSGIRYMRRIRTGDVDLDNDVDRADFARFSGCWTGPVPTDRLCDCRFLDIDHDRDVDADDYVLFLQNYTGPMEDCNNNGMLDLDDLLFGPSLDCNRNGIPDGCDIASGASPDADQNGVPDDCVYDIPKPIWREIFPVWTSRFLTIIPRNEGKQVAIKVALTSLHHPVPPYPGEQAADFSNFEGQVLWIGPPQPYVESESSGTPFWAAQLQCTPHYQDWTGIDLLHVTGSAVVPSSEYHVQTVSIGCAGKENNCPWQSEPVRIKTTRWGDVVEAFQDPNAPASQPDFDDIGALVGKFKSLAGAPIKARAKLSGIDARGLMDIAPDVGFDDIPLAVDAFKGRAYPYKPGKCAGDANKACTTDSDCAAQSVAGPCILCP